MSAARARFLVLALLAVAIPVIVWWPQLRDVLQPPAPQPPPLTTIDFGEPGGVFTWLDVNEEPVRFDMADGKRPTVVWFWSAFCPCVPDCEERIKALIRRFPDERVRFLAVDPNPHDDRADIEKVRASIAATYPVYRDPRSHSVVRMGVATSASVAVFDADGVLRFRGAIDDHITAPTVSYVSAALDALLAGDPVPRAVGEPYGCDYGIIPHEGDGVKQAE